MTCESFRICTSNYSCLHWDATELLDKAKLISQCRRINGHIIIYKYLPYGNSEYENNHLYRVCHLRFRTSLSNIPRLRSPLNVISRSLHTKASFCSIVDFYKVISFRYSLLKNITDISWPRSGCYKFCSKNEYASVNVCLDMHVVAVFRTAL